jgi:limonene-1,2-epoxide hydrolase
MEGKIPNALSLAAESSLETLAGEKWDERRSKQGTGEKDLDRFRQGRHQDRLRQHGRQRELAGAGNTPGVSGLKRGKDEILKFMSSVGQVFPEGLQSEINRAYADGNTVILELTNRGKVSNGKQYENEYCFVFEIEDGKIRRIREYADTQKAKEILFS